MAGNSTKRSVLVIAALLGLLASLLTYRFLQQAQAAQREKMLPVVVATTEIEVRTIIEPQMVTVKQVRASLIAPGSCDNEQEVIGKVSLIKIPEDVPINAKYIGDKGASLGLAFVIPPTMRAVTVAVDPVIGVAGFLKAGDHVDVVATFDRGWSEPVAKTVLQDVQLLALGGNIEQDTVKKNAGKADKIGKNTATLLVTPADAEKLVLAENQGKLRLVLRAVGDMARTDSSGATSSSLTGEKLTPPPAVGSTAVRETTHAAPPYNWPPNFAPAPPQREQPKKETASESPKPKPFEVQPVEDRSHIIEVIRGTDVEKVAVEEKK